MKFLPKISGRFFDYLLIGNAESLADFQWWLFHPGMLFQSRTQWWGKRGPRNRPHEGLDLCCYANATGRNGRVGQDFCIPATFTGQIVKIEDDFLGKSIYLGHGIYSPNGRRLFTVYGHTTPRGLLTAGDRVAEGEIIGAVSVLAKKALVRPHLHLTLAWIPPAVPVDRLSWPNLGSDPGITLIDPLIVFPTAYRIIAAKEESTVNLL